MRWIEKERNKPIDQSINQGNQVLRARCDSLYRIGVAMRGPPTRIAFKGKGLVDQKVDGLIRHTSEAKGHWIGLGRLQMERIDDRIAEQSRAAYSKTTAM